VEVVRDQELTIGTHGQDVECRWPGTDNQITLGLEDVCTDARRTRRALRSRRALDDDGAGTRRSDRRHRGQINDRAGGQDEVERRVVDVSTIVVQ
jgi:hypothetical protein